MSKMHDEEMLRNEHEAQAAERAKKQSLTQPQPTQPQQVQPKQQAQAQPQQTQTPKTVSEMSDGSVADAFFREVGEVLSKYEDNLQDPLPDPLGRGVVQAQPQQQPAQVQQPTQPQQQAAQAAPRQQAQQSVQPKAPQQPAQVQQPKQQTAQAAPRQQAQVQQQRAQPQWQTQQPAQPTLTPCPVEMRFGRVWNGPDKIFAAWTGSEWLPFTDFWSAKQAAIMDNWKVVYIYRRDGEIDHILTPEELARYMPH